MTLEKDTVEKISGNPATTLASTAVGAAAGVFIGGIPGAIAGALLPVLTGTLAHGRATKRIESTIEEIKRLLHEHKEELDKINDAQYKIITETISTIYKTIEEDKLNYLRRVVRNTISHAAITDHEAALISRIIRDLSADEAIFLVNNSHYLEIVIKHYEINTEEKDTVLYIDATDEKIPIVNGLSNLGLLLLRPASYGGKTVEYRFSPIAVKLGGLLK
ncbi:MAG TPA: hypothetical protein EYP59_11485 [Thiotrichaceae bacterium]|nr:hypothetical protein [Thiotrichaceae bacterium]